jgi:hypothetical protein
MHAPYAAQYCVIGGSGAGSGGSFTLDAAFACNEPLAAASEAPRSAVVAEAGAAAAVVVPALLPGVVPAVAAPVAPVAFVADAPVPAAAVVVVPVAFTADALASGVAAGMLALIGAAEKVLGGNGGLAGTPVDEVWVTGGLRGGICDSCAILTLVFLFASA